MDKILTVEQCLAKQSFWDLCNKRGYSAALMPGCFDLLHVGHIRTIQAAFDFANMLVIALNSDESVRALKGDGRPIIPQDERAEMLAALRLVDYVVIFDGNIVPLIQAIKPKMLVKGDDWNEQEIEGKQEIEAVGGKVVILPRGSTKTTTEIISQVKAFP